jgi:dihydrofolate reductase
MIGMIAAISQNGVIGQDNKIPFDYPEDMKFFRQTTLNSTVIMGRKTFEGIGKALPKRRNIVITRNKLEDPGIQCYNSLTTAIEESTTIIQYHDTKGELVKVEKSPIWLIGGAGIYEEGMELANIIYTTITPDVIKGDGIVRFPWINPLRFQITETIELTDKLKVLKYELR